MALIPRPPKQGGVMTYTAKVAAGFSRILAGEVDADFDTIYGAWNGGLDTVNIRDGAVTGEKLAADAVGPRELQDGATGTAGLADGAVTTPKIADGAVTDPKIVSVPWAKVTGTPPTYPAGGAAGGDLSGSYPAPSIRSGAVTAGTLGPSAVTPPALAPNAVTNAALADTSVGTAELIDLGVTRAKLALGAALQYAGGQARVDTLPLLTVDVEYVYLDFTWQSRGGPYVVLSSLHCVFGMDATAPIPQLATRIRFGGNAGTVDGTILQEMAMRDATPATGQLIVPVTLTAVATSPGTGAAPSRIKVTAIPGVKLVGYARVVSGWAIVAEWA